MSDPTLDNDSAPNNYLATLEQVTDRRGGPSEAYGFDGRCWSVSPTEDHVGMDGGFVHPLLPWGSGTQSVAAYLAGPAPHAADFGGGPAHHNVVPVAAGGDRDLGGAQDVTAALQYVWRFPTDPDHPRACWAASAATSSVWPSTGAKPAITSGTRPAGWAWRTTAVRTDCRQRT